MSHSCLDHAQQAIGYNFRQSRLLDEALTHKSHVNEVREKDRKHNERLEFLGDAVLTLIMSEYLAASFPDFTEGELSKLKARLVSEASLAKAARRLDLGNLLKLGRGEELTQGREKPSLLANVLEAILAAIYLDGGLESARKFVLRAFAQDLKELQDFGGPSILEDYKTRLQEWGQKQYDTLRSRNRPRSPKDLRGPVADSRRSTGRWRGAKQKRSGTNGRKAGSGAGC